jgi:hypothetical protein
MKVEDLPPIVCSSRVIVIPDNVPRTRSRGARSFTMAAEKKYFGKKVHEVDKAEEQPKYFHNQFHLQRLNDTMAPKRKLSESEPEEVVHPSRQVQVYGDNPKPAKKRKSESGSTKKQIHASSVNAIKKRIRDVSRKLERSQDLPANVRIENERALAAYQQELASAEAEKIRQKMIKKYHMVRFFGMQQITHFIQFENVLTNSYRAAESYKATKET